MRSYTSIYTGNTTYISDNALFSSMSKKAVERFEELGFKSIDNMDHSQKVFWSNAGCLTNDRSIYELENYGFQI